MAKFQSIWNVGNIYEDTLKSGKHALKAIERATLSPDSSQTQMYHWGAVRATTTLLRILLRNESNEARTTSERLVESCRGGIKLCRKLIPDYLTTIEDVLEAALNQ
jgi:hypothetical protein